VLQLGGPDVTAKDGMVFGRFRLVPATTQAALALAVDRNVLMTPTALVPPPPSSIASIPLPPAGTSQPAPAPSVATTPPAIAPPAPSSTTATQLPPAGTSQPAPTSSGPAPPPAAAPSSTTAIEVPPGQPLPVRQWIIRPHRGASCGTTDAVCAVEQTGLPSTKHSRAFYHPGLRSMVVGGGDRPVSMPRPGWSNGTGSEIVALNPETDTWTTLRKFCVPGEVQPKRPDTVVWALDRKRNRGLMAPGFFFGTQGIESGCGAVEGWGGYAFDFATKKWLGPDDPAIMVPTPNTNLPGAAFQGGGWGGDSSLSFGLVDNVKDELLLLKTGPGLLRMNLATKTWRSMYLDGAYVHRQQPAIDEVGRAVYLLAQPNLMKINLDAPGDFQFESIPLPPWWVMPDPGNASDWYLTFDSTNRIVVAVNNLNMGSDIVALGLYHVDTKTWERLEIPPGLRSNLWGFHEGLGAVMAMGGEAYDSPYYMIRLGAAVPTPTPTPVATLTPVPTPIPTSPATSGPLVGRLDDVVLASVTTNQPSPDVTAAFPKYGPPVELNGLPPTFSPTLLPPTSTPTSGKPAPVLVTATPFPSPMRSPALIPTPTTPIARLVGFGRFVISPMLHSSDSRRWSDRRGYFRRTRRTLKLARTMKKT